MSRSRNYTIAAVLQCMLSLASVVLGLIELPKGAAGLDVANGEPPYFSIVIGLLIGTVGLVAAYGVWRAQRWGVVLTILLRVVDGLMSFPAILFGHELWMWGWTDRHCLEHHRDRAAALAHAASPRHGRHIGIGGPNDQLT